MTFITYTQSEIWKSLIEGYNFNDINENLKNNREELIITVRKLLLEYVLNEMIKYKESGPPYLNDPDNSNFLKSRDIKIINIKMNKSKGFLKVLNDGFVIFLNDTIQKEYPRMIRTTLAHEVGHTFLYNINVNPIRPFYQPNKDINDQWKNIEEIAFSIGRQILMPDIILKRYNINVKECIDDFQSLVEKFNVSRDLMARRLVHDLKLWDVYMFFSKVDMDKEYIMPPFNKNRYKSIEFRNFNLNKYWNVMKENIKESSKNKNQVISNKIKIKKTYYNIESMCNDNITINLLKKL